MFLYIRCSNIIFFYILITLIRDRGKSEKAGAQEVVLGNEMKKANTHCLIKFGIDHLVYFTRIGNGRL